ncbi:hypothetical protein EMCRGX_G005634 [Ephydatia muelleri]
MSVQSTDRKDPLLASIDTWCKGLERWQAGLSLWVFERSTGLVEETGSEKMATTGCKSGGDVSNYYMTKLSAPQALDPGVSPPFQLWPRSSLCDVMDPKITLEEVKRTLQAIQMNSAPGQDRINYKTWKFIDLNQEVITEIFNTCTANGKISSA